MKGGGRRVGNGGEGVGVRRYEQVREECTIG